MTLLLTVLLLACAPSPPVLLTPETVFAAAAITTPWAGVPLDRLSDLGLEAPTLDQQASGWQAPWPDGGFLRVDILPDPAQARQVWLAQQAMVQVPMPPYTGFEGDVEAVGDGREILLFRDGNLVFFLRAPWGARTRADRVRAALVTEAPEGTADVRELGGVSYRWDSCGRRTP